MTTCDACYEAPRPCAEHAALCGCGETVHTAAASCWHCGADVEPRECPVCWQRVSDGRGRDEECSRCLVTCAGCGLVTELVLSLDRHEHYCVVCAEGGDTTYTLYAYGWSVDVVGLAEACAWLRDHLARTHPRSWDASVAVTCTARSDQDHDGLDDWEREAFSAAEDEGRAMWVAKQERLVA